MKFFEVSGADAGGVRIQTDAAIKDTGIRSVDRVDAASDKGSGALQAAQTLSLFEPARVVVVTTPEKVSVATARELAKLTHDGAVIFTGEKSVSAAVRKALPSLHSSKHPLPQPNNAGSWVLQRFKESGVSMPEGVLPKLSEVAVEPLGAFRIRQLAAMLCESGNPDPTPDLVEALTHDLGVSEAMWASSDAATRGDVSRARPGMEVEPIVALSMLARRLSRIGAVLEGTRPTSDLAGLFGASDSSVQMLGRGVTISPGEVSSAFDIVIDAAARCREASDAQLSRAIADDASLKVAQIFSK